MKKTLEQFVEEAEEKHNYLYDYSKFVYVTNKTKGIIMCKEHGEYEQTPKAHLQGHGCPKCFGNKKKTLDQFIEEAEDKHASLYDYSKFVYKNYNTKGIIICKEHGAFEQLPSSHLLGRGCPKCSGNIKKTLEQFIEEAKRKHAPLSLYDYSKFVYKNARTKGIIICKEHNEFEQIPSKHLQGQGCPNCYGNKKKTLQQFIK